MSLVYNNKNVYILGAGFSKPFGMPIVRDFLNTMREALEYFESVGSSREVDAITTVLKFRREAASSAYRINIDIENIEHLFSLSSAVEQHALSKAMKDSIAATIEFSSILRQNREKDMRYFLLKASDSGRVENLGGGFKVINPNSTDFIRYDIESLSLLLMGLLGCLGSDYRHSMNTFLTFNYDQFVERALMDLGIPFNYSLDYTSIDESSAATKWDGVSVLKLHGSVNWSYPGGRGSNLKVYADYQGASSNDDFLIVPPTWQKQFDGMISRVWQKAVEAISTATRIVIIGFSIPETDTHFRYLVGAGLKENISLREIVFVNPVAEVSMAAKLDSFLQPGFKEQFFRYRQSGTEELIEDGTFLPSIGRYPVRY